LAVTAASTESCDPLPWVKRLLQVRAKLDGTTTDPWRRRQIDWEIGEGLSDALVATQKRGDAADMLDNATLTAAYLERGAELRQLTPTERKNLGDLLFRIGILHSLQKGDHAAAVTWFDKVLPLWEGNPAFARDGETGQLGESLVSMAITYWQVDRRDDAVAINRKGIDLMVEAVEQQTLNEQSLAVAYGNLSTMYAEQGDDERARNYAELATRAEATGSIRK
jgi:tetratricopeptide (TPR) repeat protein